MKKTLLLFTFLLIAIASAYSQSKVEWIRYPALSPDGSTFVFTYKGNLYTVGSEGGEAHQITFHSAHDYKAVWSPDGKQIAFASDRYGNFDVFIMDALGGEAKRLTYHSSDEYPYTFSIDGKQIVFSGLRQDKVEHRQFPTSSQHELYAIATEGGQVDQIFTVPAEEAVYNSTGSMMIYQDKKGGENEWRKHHTSAITRDLWIYDTKKNTHKQLTIFEGEDRNPEFLAGDDNTLYFLTEQSGVFNVHEMTLDNPKIRKQLTFSKKHPVRFLSTGGRKLAFTIHGLLYTMKPGEEAKEVPVFVRTQDIANSDKVIPINGGVEEMAISPNGKEIAIVVRGEVFVTNVDGSLTKRVTNTPWTEGHIAFNEDGKELYYASEREGKWSIFKSTKQRDIEPFFYASTLLKEEAVIDNKSDNYLPQISPDGSKIAFIEDRTVLKVMDLKSKKTVTLLGQDQLYTFRDGDQSFSWSPDSKWILFNYSKSLSDGEVVLLDASGDKEMINLTKSGYYEGGASFTKDGKEVLFVTNRYGLKSYATSGRSQYDVMALFLDKESWDKYQMSEEDFKLMQELEKQQKKEEKDDKDDKKKDKKEDEKKEVEPIKIDFNDIVKRKARLSFSSASVSSYVLDEKGEKLYYIATYGDDTSLWEVELRTKENKQLITLKGGGSLVWDKDYKNLYLLSRGSISEVDLGAKRTKGVKIQAEMRVDESAERNVLFEHVWLRSDKIFYHSNFHGIDWEAMGEAYRKKLPFIGNEYELTELLSEMIGELNVSHAGARYSGSIENGDATASTGLLFDWDFKGKGLKVAEVIKNGPFDKVRFDVHKGDILTSIDGVEIDGTFDWAKLLNRKSGVYTLFEFKDAKKPTSKTATVKPISSREESGLLYDRWVEMNRKEVLETTKGEIGYVHIPGMSDGPYRSIYEDMMGPLLECKAIIVDTRFNGGGDLVSDLAMFFTGKPFLTYATETKVVGGEPTSRYTKPTLAMYNEAMYSDGHCFASSYAELGIGTTVGMPVPGTCSFAGWERLSNGVVWGIVPVSAKNGKGEWMENNQTYPDIMVKNQPDVISKGRDQQLEVAIKTLSDEVK